MRLRPPSRALADLAALAKLRISLLSALSAAAGFVAFAREPRAPLAATLAGTFLLAAGAAALNEVLDREEDARMERTRDRPIPAGRIGPATALALAIVAAGGGAALLWSAAGLLPALLGAGAFVWYDAVYTPLKRVTAFAVLPGAIVGAIPPALGWTAAGGAPVDPRILALCAFFLLWQIPHFWLLALRHADDLARGGLPTPSDRFSAAQMRRVAFVWTLSTGAAALLLPLFRVTRTAAGAFALAAGAATLAPAAWRLLRDADAEAAGRAFASVNRFALAVMAVVAADALLSP